MKRLPIGIIVLAGLLILGVWIGRTADKVHGNIAQELAAAAGAESWSQTAPADDARAAWEAHRSLSAAIADHTVLDEIESYFAQLEVYRRHRDLTQFTATCARLSELISALEEGHRLCWENVL